MTSNERQTPTAEPGRRQRARRADVHIAHEALKVATPANEQIGPWQERAAWLCALAERRRLKGKDDPRIAAEARQLLAAVEQRHADLKESMQSLPVAVARSSRLDDTIKALDSITKVLQRTIELASPAEA